MKYSPKTIYVLSWIGIVFVSFVIIGLLAVYGWIMPILHILHPLAIVFAIFLLLISSLRVIVNYHQNRKREETVGKFNTQQRENGQQKGLPSIKTMKKG